MATYCPGCKNEVPTYTPKGSDLVHYKRHFTDPTQYAADQQMRDRCMNGGQPVVDEGIGTKLHEKTEQFLGKDDGYRGNGMDLNDDHTDDAPITSPEEMAEKLGCAVHEIGEVLQAKMAEAGKAMKELSDRFTPPKMNRAQRRAMKFGRGDSRRRQEHARAELREKFSKR